MSTVYVNQNPSYSGYYDNASAQMMLLSSQNSITEELIRASKGKEGRLLELLGPGAAKVLKKLGGKRGLDIRERLMLLLELILAEIDKSIEQKINELHKLSKKMKSVTQKQAEKHPGLTQGYQTESAITQQLLTMQVQKRQRLIENIANALKTMHDADANTIRRII